MVCCEQYCAAQAQFGRKRAERDLRRYLRRGADSITKLLLKELRRWPLQGLSLLDVGSGIGVIDMELAGDGVGTATVVEASPAYFEASRGTVERCYGSRPVQFVVGDFTALAPTLADADVVTLDRVVCCYPDAEGLLRRAAQRARLMIAYTYPRNRWYVHAFMAFQNARRRLTGNPFRSFLHSPERMSATLETAGLKRISRQGNAVWMVELYHQARNSISQSYDRL